MTVLRILADDLTGALDCAAAFGAGVPVHLGQPTGDGAAQIDIVATATRDVPANQLPGLLAPSQAWLQAAGVAFKKVDSLLRGNTFDEIDLLARRGDFAGLVMAPAFPAQGRVTEAGQQWWQQPDGTRTPVAESMRQALQARGWAVHRGAQPPGATAVRTAWIPDVPTDAALDAVVAAGRPVAAGWLWCGSAGLAHAMARTLALPPRVMPQTAAPGAGPVMLVSASHHAVTRGQWQLLRDSMRAGDCLQAEDPQALVREASRYPALIDLSPQRQVSAVEAAQLLARQAALIAQHAPRPRALVVVGGDTLLALCRALGAQGLQSALPLDRPGWGSARLVGGRWNGVTCHTRSGAFGGAQDLLQVLDRLD